MSKRSVTERNVILMPGMSGAEVARCAQVRPGLPIVFVSGYWQTAALDGIAVQPFCVSRLTSTA